MDKFFQIFPPYKMMAERVESLIAESNRRLQEGYRVIDSPPIVISSEEEWEALLRD